MSASKSAVGSDNDSIHEGNAHEQLLAEFRAQRKELTLVKIELTLVKNELAFHARGITCMMVGIVEPTTLHTINTCSTWMFRFFVVADIRPSVVAPYNRLPEVPYPQLIRENRSSDFLSRLMRFGDVYELEDFATMWSDVVSSPSLQIHYPLVALANRLWESGTISIPPIPPLTTASDPTWFGWR